MRILTVCRRPIRLMSSKVELEVDGRAVSVPAGTTVMQACQEAGAQIPHFCYHKRLSVAGNCRMCLVEVEKSAKPIASCAMPALNGMKVLTNSPLAKKAREGVLEFILANHPLDCPICDQGGECDLQDLAMSYGNDRSRFTDIRHLGKRAVVDKEFGPLIATSMTKCIQCTRCVRFANQVAGIPDLGVSGRGSFMQIGMYVEKLLLSELSGNVIDLCPVGALVSKPYLFTSRPWELSKVNSIDVSDALGSNIVVSSRAGSLIRITPRINEQINEEWISDKARFWHDGLRYQRLTAPMLIGSTGHLEECLSWKTALEHLAEKMTSKQIKDKSSISAIVGDLTDCETILATKDLLAELGSDKLFVGEFAHNAFPKFRSGYCFSGGLASVEQADHVILINTNPRYDAPVFNARIRKAWMENQVDVSLIGPRETDLSYPYTHLGTSLANYAAPKKSAKPMVILGTHNLTPEIYDHAKSLADSLGSTTTTQNPIFNVLHNHASSVGALDLGCKPLTSLPDSEVIIVLGYDDKPIVRPASCKLLIYIGHHGDVNAPQADLVLPGSAYTEKTATYVNTEGRVQSTLRAVSPPGMARDDWKIVRAMGEAIGVRLPYDNLEEIRAHLNGVLAQAAKNVGENGFGQHKKTKPPSSDLLRPRVMSLRDFFMTDSISRNSIVMAKATEAVRDDGGRVEELRD